MDRLVLSDEQRQRIAPHLPGKPGDPGRSASDNRMLLEAVLWIARLGAPWRDLPEMFGKWNSVFQRFSRWAKKGVFERLFALLSGDSTLNTLLSMERWSRFTGMEPAQKGGLEIRRSEVERRLDDQNRPAR